MTAIKNELMNSLTSFKKEMSTKSKKHQVDSRTEMDKLIEETKSNRDKLQKLAIQFDKELSDRDKQHNSLK